MRRWTMADACAAYRAANDRGDGFAPTHETVNDAQAAYVADGWAVVLDRASTSDVALMVSPHGRMLAIGGDAMGGNAWCVVLPEVTRWTVRLDVDALNGAAWDVWCEQARTVEGVTFHGIQPDGYEHWSVDAPTEDAARAIVETETAPFPDVTIRDLAR